MLIKVSEAANVQLDWLVAKCEGLSPDIWGKTQIIIKSAHKNGFYAYSPSTDWAQGGPIIKRELIETRPELHENEEFSGVWSAFSMSNGGCWHYGPTPLVAAMRCYVVSKLGDAVDILEI